MKLELLAVEENHAALLALIHRMPSPDTPHNALGCGANWAVQVIALGRDAINHLGFHRGRRVGHLRIT